MKITHNKIGQNLNLVDTGKADKAEGAKNKNANQIAGGNNPIADALQTSSSAKVELSPRAQEAKRIKELAMAAPDIDQEKVAKFRQLIDEGKYKVDAKAVADRMVDEHLETSF
ncbi:MAG: flagellar biosynthesis anti-sigma factor FlgM [Bdellovibrionia bacterium]